MNHPERAKASALWTVLFILAGIDGFRWLEPLRELGARPFYLLYLLLLIVWVAKRRIQPLYSGCALLAVLLLVSAVGFAFNGASLPVFGDKVPSQQFVAHEMLFLLGFSPLMFRVAKPVSIGQVIASAKLAAVFHLVALGVDLAGMLLFGVRPFEAGFTAPGALARDFPTGLFSEPSYAAAYFGMILPLLLSSGGIVSGLAVSVFAAVVFFVGEVRSFFLVYAAGIGCLIVLRGGAGWKSVLALLSIAAVVVIASIELSIVSVQESLSSAYRIGNSIAYLQWAIANDLFLGSGMGSSHFLYRSLDFPYYMYLSEEFQDMLSGGAGSRVPVFNVWIRLFVEVGVFPTAILVANLIRRVRRRIPDGALAFSAACLAMTFSVDSYIYGMQTIALLMICSLGWKLDPNSAPTNESALPAASLRAGAQLQGDQPA